MKIEKLPSGSYRVRPTYKGKRYSMTFTKRPTKDDIQDELNRRINESDKRTSDMTFETAAINYVDCKRNVLSPSTIRDYSKMHKRLPSWFVKLPVQEITQADINRLVNEVAKTKAPKTVKNYHGFVSAVLAVYHPELTIRTKLPQNTKKDFYIPSDDDIRKIVSASKGTRMEIPIALSCYGLRRSEMLAITPDCIEHDKIIIKSALVLNEHNKAIIKETTKTAASTRVIPISHDLALKIKKQGYVFDGNPSDVNKWLVKTEQKLGLPHFTLHKFRHYFASKLSDMGIPEADILNLGGWETDHIMKSVYRHSMMKDNDKKDITDKLSQALFS